MLPQSYPNYKTVHRRFQTWCRDEVLRRFRARRMGPATPVGQVPGEKADQENSVMRTLTGYGIGVQARLKR
jgi:transposase